MAAPLHASAADEATTEHFRFLDELRDSGRINMFGAPTMLQSEFPELKLAEARDIMLAWMAER